MRLVIEILKQRNQKLQKLKNMNEAQQTIGVPSRNNDFFFGFIVFVSTPKPEAMVVCLTTNLTCISWYMGNWCISIRFPYSVMPFGRWHRKFSCWSGGLRFYIVNWWRLNCVTRARGLVAMNLTLRPSRLNC